MADLFNVALHLGATICTGVVIFGFWDEATRYRPYNLFHRRVTAGALAIFGAIILGAIWL